MTTMTIRPLQVPVDDKPHPAIPLPHPSSLISPASSALSSPQTGLYSVPALLSQFRFQIRFPHRLEIYTSCLLINPS